MQKKSPVKSVAASLPAQSLAKSKAGGARSLPKSLEAAAPAPTREEIARRAYEIYMARGSGGRETEDWAQAERELTAKAHRRN